MNILRNAELAVLWMRKEFKNMFFGPFLPFVPILFILEYLPEQIGEPIQAFILSSTYYLGLGVEGIFDFLFK